MKKMKKLLAMLLALTMTVSLMIPTVFAEEINPEDPAGEPAPQAEVAASFTSDDPDDYDMISLADVKTFTAKLPLTAALSDEDLAKVAGGSSEKPDEWCMADYYCILIMCWW
jgi:hypothetical protein